MTTSGTTERVDTKTPVHGLMEVQREGGRLLLFKTSGNKTLRLTFQKGYFTFNIGIIILTLR